MSGDVILSCWEGRLILWSESLGLGLGAHQGKASLSTDPTPMEKGCQSG